MDGLDTGFRKMLNFRWVSGETFRVELQGHFSKVCCEFNAGELMLALAAGQAELEKARIGPSKSSISS